MRRVYWLCLVILIFAPGSPLLADIFRWDDGTVIPGTEGIEPGPGVQLVGLNMAYAALSGANLAGSKVDGSNLTYARLARVDFTGASLLNVNMKYSELFEARLSGAVVRGADFARSTMRGFSAEQLYSTASYQSLDLANIDLSQNDLQGWNFRNQNLAGSDFSQANLAEVDFHGANLNSSNFTGATFANTSIAGAWISRANLSGVTAHGFSLQDLYATASYREKQLPGINFTSTDLTGARLNEQDLAGATFNGADLTDVTFRGANLIDASFDRGWNADFAFADLRGSRYFSPQPEETRNAILRDGAVMSLLLVDSEQLVVRNYQKTRSTFPVSVHDRFSMDSQSALKFLFEEERWKSIVRFEPGISVARDGTLELAFKDDIDVAAQVGRTFQLFDWTGVEPTGEFAIRSDYRWDVSRLYSTGEVTLTAVPEPATYAMALFGVGAMGLAARMRRRR